MISRTLLLLCGLIIALYAQSIADISAMLNQSTLANVLAANAETTTAAMGDAAIQQLLAEINVTMVTTTQNPALNSTTMIATTTLAGNSTAHAQNSSSTNAEVDQPYEGSEAPNGDNVEATTKGGSLFDKISVPDVSLSSLNFFKVLPTRLQVTYAVSFGVSLLLLTIFGCCSGVFTAIGKKNKRKEEISHA
ncbi:unnamed protein product, partial [Mesorhabditis spiculigera]